MMRPTLDLGMLFPPVRVEYLPAERAVLGALIRGTLRSRDVAALDPSDYHYQVHGDVHEALLVVGSRRDLWPSGQRSVAGLPLGACMAVCSLRGLLVAGYLRELAAAAPGRRQAVAAVAEVRRGAAERDDAERGRARMLRDFAWWATDAAQALRGVYHDRELAAVAS